MFYGCCYGSAWIHWIVVAYCLWIMENWKNRLLSIYMTVSNDISLHAGFIESINNIEDLMILIRSKYYGACNVYYEILAYPISCFFSWHIETELGHHRRAKQKNMLCTVVCTVVMKVAVWNLILFLHSQTSYLQYINVYVSQRLLYHRHSWTISFGDIIPQWQ